MSTPQQPTSTIKFYSGVPHQDSFTETLYFDNVADQEAWYEQFHQPQFDMSSADGTASYYQRVGHIIKTPWKYEDILACNYVRVENPSYVGSTNSVVWWGFIDDIQYSSNAMVEINWSVDHLQTFMFDYYVDNSFIVKTHLNEYSQALSATNRYPMPAQSIVESSAWYSNEGLGGDGVSELVDQQRIVFIEGDVADELGFFVFKSAYDTTGSIITNYWGINGWLIGSDTGAPDQLATFIVPFSILSGNIMPMQVINADGSTTWINQGISAGTKLYKLLTLLGLDKLMTQGTLGTAYYTRSIGQTVTFDPSTGLVVLDLTHGSQDTAIHAVTPNPTVPSGAPPGWLPNPMIQLAGLEMFTNMSPETGQPLSNLSPWEFLYGAFYEEADSQLLELFGDYPPIKVFRSPFFSMKIDNGRGMQQDFDLRLFNQSGIQEKLKLYRVSGVSNSSIINYFIEYYGVKDALDLSTTTTTADGTYYNNSLISQQSFLGLIEQNDTSVQMWTQALTAYMNANQNQINVNKKNAQLNYDNTRMSNQVQLENLATTQGANAQIQANNNGTSFANQMLSNNYGAENFALSSGKSLASLFTGKGASNALNALIGGSAAGLNMRASQDMNLAQLNNNMQLANSSLAIGQQADTQNTQNSVDTSNKVAASQETMTINGINAGIMDMANQAPNASGQGSEISHDWANWNQSLNLQRWRAKEQSIISAMITYQLYGYTLSNYKDVTATIQLNKRAKFNFIQTVGANVLSNSMNGKWRNMIRVSYDKGLRIWWDPDAYITRDITANQQVNFDPV